MIKGFTTYFKRFLKYSITDKKLFFEALFLMFASKVCLILFSFKYCIKLTNFKHVHTHTVKKNELIKIKKALNRTGHLAIWKNTCLVQSLAARWMLNRRKIKSVLKVGVTHDKDKNIIAHAWVNVDDFEVINKGSGYSELISF